MLDFESILEAVEELFSTKVATVAPSHPDDVPADVNTILHSTEKLLAVSKGNAEPDERDSLEFRRVHTPDKLFAERIQLDADRLRRHSMRRLAKMRNLKALSAAHWDPYVEGLIVGNPLSSPLEEINPLSLVEQARRITAMGPGGIPSDESVTAEMSNIHPSSFGFLSPLENPESSRAGIDNRIAIGVKWGSDGNLYQRFRNPHTGRHHWLNPGDLQDKVLALPD